MAEECGQRKKGKKNFRPKAKVPRGLRDSLPDIARTEAAVMARIGEIYESCGFEPLDTPALEYAEAIGKFLPDQDRPNEGVFSFQDEDGQWLSLRYDLTAPLARFVAENYESLPKPFRRYQSGSVWRNEKPGPGRFRQFTQFDVDSVGAPGVEADAELCMLAADCLEALGIARGTYRIRVSNRKILDGVLETAGIRGEGAEFERQRLAVMRAVDKLDRLGPEGVGLLLGKGRKDDSGDFTPGANLPDSQTGQILAFTQAGGANRQEVCDRLEGLAGESERGREGVEEMRLIDSLLAAAGYESERIVFDPSVVRGLGYYTGPVFEAELTSGTDEDEGTGRFGAIGGGGRYDNLVERFKGIKVPATGFSIGVSRLVAALQALDKTGGRDVRPPVVVLVMEREHLSGYQQMTRELRAAGIRAELYLGGSGMRAQLKYADRRGAPCIVIEGENEREEGRVTLKDLALGASQSTRITDNEEWRQSRHAQVSVPRDGLVEGVRKILDRYGQT